MLYREELLFAHHLADILENDESDAGLFVATIMPVYFEMEGKGGEGWRKVTLPFCCWRCLLKRDSPLSQVRGV